MMRRVAVCLRLLPVVAEFGAQRPGTRAPCNPARFGLDGFADTIYFCRGDAYIFFWWFVLVVMCPFLKRQPPK